MKSNLKSAPAPSMKAPASTPALYKGVADFGSICTRCYTSWEDHWTTPEGEACPRGGKFSYAKKFGSEEYATMHNCVLCDMSFDHHAGNACPRYGERAFIDVPMGKVVAITSKMRTQKARGLNVLRNNATLFGVHYPRALTIAIENVEPSHLLGRFVRPCPVTPRHGFVDSRVIKDAEEAKALLNETLQADPQAEVLLMEPIAALASGIWTPGFLTLGAGNDGATAGKSSVTLPVLGTLVPNPKMLVEAGVTDAPYIEIVWGTDGSANLVQLRNGPKLDAADSDYIPHALKVKKVVSAEGDLLEWEKRVKTFKRGTVVWHEGGSLASHYAVHAVLSQIPVIISHEPRVGEMLKASATGTQEMDLRRLRAGFMAAMKDKEMSYKNAGYTMLAALHNFVLWKGKHDLLLGMGMGYAARLAMIASIAEFRHYPRMVQRNVYRSRESEYREHWPTTVSAHSIGRFLRALKSFIRDHWGGDMGSYGGPKWYEFGAHALKMYNALALGDADDAVAHFNVLVNAVHNGGWGFDKFLDDYYMNEAAKNPALPVVWGGADIYRMLKTDARAFETLADWEDAPRFTDYKRDLGLEGKSLSDLQERWVDARCHIKKCITCHHNHGPWREEVEALVPKACFYPSCDAKLKTFAGHKKHLVLKHGHGGGVASLYAEAVFNGLNADTYQQKPAPAPSPLLKLKQPVAPLKPAPESIEESVKAKLNWPKTLTYEDILKEMAEKAWQEKKVAQPTLDEMLKVAQPTLDEMLSGTYAMPPPPAPKPLSPIKHVQVCWREGGATLHAQIVREKMGYLKGYETKDLNVNGAQHALLEKALGALATNSSLAGSSTPYHVLPYDEQKGWHVPMEDGAFFEVVKG